MDFTFKHHVLRTVIRCPDRPADPDSCASLPISLTRSFDVDDSHVIPAKSEYSSIQNNSVVSRPPNFLLHILFGWPRKWFVDPPRLGYRGGPLTKELVSSSWWVAISSSRLAPQNTRGGSGPNHAEIGLITIIVSSAINIILSYIKRKKAAVLPLRNLAGSFSLFVSAFFYRGIEIGVAMASHGVVGFVGLDELSMEIASLLVRSGFRVQAYEVSILLLSLLLSFFSALVCGKSDSF